MATRLYHASIYPSSFEPAFSAAWDVTTGAVRRLLEAGPTIRALTATQTFNTSKTAAGPLNQLICQFILFGLAAQNISGNFKGQALMNESVGTVDAGVQCQVRIWRPSTQSYVGTLLSRNNYGAISGTPGNVGYELATTLTNRKIPSGWSGSGDALTAQDCEDYDCLVIEVGTRHFEGASAARTLQLRSLSNAGTDLAEDETTTTSNNPWFEFSDTLTLKARASAARVDAISPWGDLDSPQVGQLWPRGGRGR